MMSYLFVPHRDDTCYEPLEVIKENEKQNICNIYWINGFNSKLWNE